MSNRTTNYFYSLHYYVRSYEAYDHSYLSDRFIREGHNRKIDEGNLSIPRMFRQRFSLFTLLFIKDLLTAIKFYIHSFLSTNILSVKYMTIFFFIVRGCYPWINLLSWRTTLCRLSVIAYSIYTGRTTMNIGVLKLCRIYYSDLTITNYTSNERVTQAVCPRSILARAHDLVPPSSVRSASSQDGN